MFKRILTSVMVTMAVASASLAVDVAIDRGTTYQAITGFGAQHIGAITVKEGPFYITKPKTGIYDSLVNDLGLSMHRHFMPTGWDGSHDHETPHDVLLDMKELHDRGVEVFIATLLGPPGYMKDNGIPEQGGHVLPEWYDSLGGTKRITVAP